MPSIQIDIEDLLKPGAGPEACGPDLKYDPDYIQLEDKAAGTPGTEMGNARTAGVPPDWQAVWSMLPDLLRRSKDLRLAVMACRALAFFDGPSGAALGLELIQQLLTRYWPVLYPKLDADDGTPLARKHALQILLRPQGIRDLLAEHTLINDGFFGKITLSAMLRALAGVSEAGDPAPEQARALLEDHKAIRDITVAASLSAAKTMETLSAQLAEWQVQNLDLNGLVTYFRQIAHQFAPDDVAPPPPPQGALPDVSGLIAAPRPKGANGGDVGGAIGGDADVVATLDAICAYYAQAEPSSPVPLILRRARRLVGADFNHILRDLAASGISDFERVSGTPVPELPESQPKT
jgi:type VI secretion system protein ImpA